MAHADGVISTDVAGDVARTSTKKSLRLSKKKQLTLIRETEELQKKEKEEQQKTESDKKEKEEDNNAIELDEYDAEAKGRQKRHWESWAKADKDLFFEAVSEFGKDFDKICSFMDKKVKTRGKSVKDCEPRNKDQIRYFYYRTWKQISKVVSLQPSESKRIQHEIYCMICYGELRKKCRGFGNKDLKRLDELVSTGSTTVRHKGRKIRIKPPSCRFLKRLSEEEDKSTREQGSIPENIDVELFPRTNKEWTMAQRLALNPRVRLHSLPITLKVKSLVKLLHRRVEKSFDCPTTEDIVIKLFPPKGLVISDVDKSTTSALGELPKETVGEVSSDKVSAKSPIDAGSRSSGNLSVDSDIKSGTTCREPATDILQQGSPQSNCLIKEKGSAKFPSSTLPMSSTQSATLQSFVKVLAVPVPHRTSVPKIDSPSLPAVQVPLEEVSVLLPSSLGTTAALPLVDTPLNGITTHSVTNSNLVNQVSALGSSGISTLSAADSLVVPNAQGPFIEGGNSVVPPRMTAGSLLGGNIVNVSGPKGQDSVSTDSAVSTLSRNNTTFQASPITVIASTLSSDNATSSATPVAPDNVSAAANVPGSNLVSQVPDISHTEGNAGKDAVASSQVEPQTSDHITTGSKDTQRDGEDGSTAFGEKSMFFPITLENCIDKDLQACCLALNRPDVIRLEYEVDAKHESGKKPSLSGFDKLILLAQRDLCKALKVTTQQMKAVSAASKTNQLPRSIEVKPSQAVKPMYIAATVPLPRHCLQDGGPTGTKPVLVSASSLKSSVGIVPALKNVVKQRKVIPRLRPIQPASKTLMAKAVAVNIVPQPAQLAQYAQVPAVSTQLINSGASAMSTVNLTSAETQPIAGTTGAVSGASFSSPSTSTASTQLTIWGCPTTEPVSASNVQVEVIEEGSRGKASAKRLRPTSVMTTEKPVKFQRLQAAGLSKEANAVNSLDLSFLGNDEESRDSGQNPAAGSINLSSILSGLTKNLCKTNTSGHEKVVATSVERLDTQPAVVATTVVPLKNSIEGTTGGGALATVTVTTSAISSVLTTPVKGATKTPPKSENSVDCYKAQHVPFDSQWFGGEITELSLGGILDVGNFSKDVAKSSESSQASEISIGSLLNVHMDKKGAMTSPSPTQISDVSLGALLDAKDESSKGLRTQGSELSIGKLLGTLQKGENSKNQAVLTEPAKPCNSDSLLMKPDTDPVTVFESLMNESSVDYINKFKDLTAKLKAEDASNKPHIFPVANNTQSEEALKGSALHNNTTSLNSKDPRLPIYTSEDSVGPLDDLSFVLSTNDSNSNDFAKSFA